MKRTFNEMKNISNWILIIFIILMILFTTYLFSLKKQTEGLSKQYNNSNLENTGSDNYETSIGTSNTKHSTGNTEAIPDGIDEYFEYIIENGIEGEDFIEKDLSPAPFVKYKDKEDNNEKIIYPYFKDNILHFKIPYTSKKGYIAIITNKEVASTRDILLGINGVVVGPIRKDKSLSKLNNLYIYEMDNIIIAGTNGKGKDLYKNIINGELNINAYVGESGNYVEKIIIFFK